jgi:IS30 family transposase
LTNTEAPKGTDLAKHPDEYVRSVCKELNTRPRKSLGYLTPEVLLQTEKALFPFAV